MKKILAVIGLLLYSGASLAGGSIGGGGGSIQLENPAFDLMRKTYIEDPAYRRLNARLSVDGAKSIPFVVGDEAFDLQKMSGRIVDLNISNEILSLSGFSVGGGSETSAAQ
jgi:hypothetical protein